MERVFSSVTEIVNGFDVDPGVKSALVVAAWSHVAGEMLSDRAEAVRYEDGRLTVAVEDQTWKHNLEALAPQMIARLNARLGESTVSFIEFRISRARRGARTEERPTSSAVPKKVRDAAERIGDPALRERFLNAAAAYLKED